MRSSEGAPPGTRRVAGKTGTLTTVTMVAVLAGIVVIGAAFLGPARFEGVRWLPTSRTVTSTATTSAAPSETPAPTESPRPRRATAIPLVIDVGLVLWISAAIALLLIAFFMARWARARQRAGEPVAGEAVAEDDSTTIREDGEGDALAVQRGLGHALRILSEDREPADAIVKAWLGLQEAAEDSGLARRPAETPTEFTSRILGGRRVDGRDRGAEGAGADESALAMLLDLYLRVRFGRYRATATDIARARRAVASLDAGWAGRPDSSTPNDSTPNDTARMQREMMERD